MNHCWGGGEGKVVTVRLIIVQPM